MQRSTEPRATSKRLVSETIAKRRQAHHRPFTGTPARLCGYTISAPYEHCNSNRNDDDGATHCTYRFHGERASIITDCDNKDDDAFEFTLDNGKKKIEGEYHLIRYQFPSTASKAQVVRNLNTAMRRAGYKMVYDSGDYGDFTGVLNKTWFQIEVSSSGAIKETIVKEIALTQDVVASAADLSNGLTSTGHTVVNGILFDTAKSDVKPESEAALQEVAKLLKENASLKLYVVGHTDNVGASPANVELSKRHAAAVVQVLTSKYGVTANRLESFGNGPFAPVASNTTEDGRASNRRVEIVAQ